VTGYDEVLGFWFEEISEASWWKKDPAFDQLIRDRFGALHASASRAELFAWRVAPRGRLAEVIILDQFSRNLYRDDARAFALDSMALALAQEAVGCGADQPLSAAEKSFLYLPYMHSESVSIHQQAVVLFQQPGLEKNLDFELRHKAIIDQYGRYPHRNHTLGRVSTEQEQSFLQQPGSSF
tara:strand:+ start:4608 stop:5150 length:543 start_codon:yes stop_codon:yes gene_type:complete